MSAAEPEETILSMLSTTDHLQEKEIGMYLMHIQKELQEQRAACQGQAQTERTGELNLLPVSL